LDAKGLRLVIRAALALLAAGGLTFAPCGVCCRSSGPVRSRHSSSANTLAPSTGKRWGACAGYVRDHINPLCNGGPDAVSNMQWQMITDARAKDRWERAICRGKR
jgi:hypothetical protein